MATSIFTSCDSKTEAQPNKPTVELDKETASIEVGKNITLIATTEHTEEKVEWSSDELEVATVVDGLVTGVAAGTATITVKVGDISDSCVVTVTTTTTPEATIRLNPKTAAIKTGETVTITATTEHTEEKVEWSSSDDKIATVTEAGIVKGVAKGEVTITATADKATANCVVTVNEPTVTIADVSIGIQETATLTATLAGIEGAVVWSSENTDVVTILDGVVTGIKLGSATISAEVGEIIGTCVVTVVSSVNSLVMKRNVWGDAGGTIFELEENPGEQIFNFYTIGSTNKDIASDSNYYEGIGELTENLSLFLTPVAKGTVINFTDMKTPSEFGDKKRNRPYLWSSPENYNHTALVSDESVYIVVTTGETIRKATKKYRVWIELKIDGSKLPNHKESVTVIDAYVCTNEHEEFKVGQKAE